MPHPTPHPKSGVYRARIAVPAHLRAIIERDHGKRTELSENLGTKDRAAAIRASRPVFERFDRWLQAAQAEHDGRPVTLSDRDIEVLCGQWVARQEAENLVNLKGTATDHEEAASYLGGLLHDLEPNEDGRPASHGEVMVAASEDITATLPSTGQAIDDDSRRRLAVRLVHLRWQWHRDAEQRARSGQWRPSVTSADFPTALVKAATRCTTDALLDGWGLDRGLRRDAQPRQRAFYDRQRTMERLVAFLGHNDATKITKADAVRLKEDMQARNLTAATIRNDLSELSAIWRWGMSNGKVMENPFAGISPPKAKKRAREVRPFTPDEARRVLEAARKETGALRWLPWVCAHTGARLGEVAQSAKEDVTTVSGVICLRIHDDGDDGRSVKNDASRRSVPIHPALVAEGFLDYVASLPVRSSLWPDVKPDKVFGRRSETAGRMVRKWLRGLGITDERISPSHSWRHTFIDACRAIVMPVEVRSAITGHAGRADESARYGGGMRTMIQVMADHIGQVEISVPPS